MTTRPGSLPLSPPCDPALAPSANADAPPIACYLINLDRASLRRRHMEDRLARIGLPFERVPAVDGSALAFPREDLCERSLRVMHGRRRNAAEVGCYLSHVACARRLLDSPHRFALVLEDDVAFPADFLDLLNEIIRHADSWDLLRLTTVNTGPKLAYRRLNSGRSLAIALLREKGAGAYVINRRAAAWISDLIPMRLPFDLAFDLEYLSGLRSAFVTPVPLRQSEEPVSQIQIDLAAYKYSRWRYLTVMPVRTGLEIARFALRLSRYVRLRLGTARKQKPR
ncbi:glycosyltransferase family 25 protein [Roseateles sp. L2-2]|uniref:glycosyltransferase family 25 protein n=1 Tax=Roseateles sp. L2-2 TaxID=3422597 RepID=UPI003D35B74F